MCGENKTSIYFATIMTISLIVARAKDNAIGKDNDLLWKIKDDLRLFKRTTAGHVVIHGRKSFESIGFPLPNRSNIIITRNKHYKAEGAFVTNSLEEAIELGQKLEMNGEIFILGGAEIYRQSLDVVDRMYLSEVKTEFPDADAYFPEPNLQGWNQVKCDTYEQSEANEFAFDFCVWERG
jgi:dihydrofolate reductase